MILNYYNKDIDKVIKELSSNIDKGLTKEEVLKRRKQSGINEITDTNKITPLKRFLMQFNNAMIILLLIVGILSLIYSYVTKTDYTDAFVILFSVIVNAIMGYIQEKKAEDSLETLKSYVTSKVKVIREGKNFEVDSKDLVIGDIITLESGDKIPADSRIIKSINALVDESILTGESQSVEKTKEVLYDIVENNELVKIRNAGLICMDTLGRVESGNVDDISIQDLSMPYGLRTDYEKLTTETKTYYENIKNLLPHK